MAAVTVSDFYVASSVPARPRVSRCGSHASPTIGWGVVQIFVALGAQWMDRSVLDAGLAVLSLASGPVLGAFLVGVFTRRVGSAAMLAGMATGAAVLIRAVVD
jgi:Na+/proline symporter